MTDDIVREVFQREPLYGLCDWHINISQSSSRQASPRDTPPHVMFASMLTGGWERIQRRVVELLGPRPRQRVPLTGISQRVDSDLGITMASMERLHHNRIIWRLPKAALPSPWTPEESRLRQVMLFLWHWVNWHDQSS